MLVPKAHFALLATFCSLATLGLSPRWGVDAAAIQTQTRPFDHCHCHDVTFDQPPTQYVLPLPLKSKIKRFKVRTHEPLGSDPLAMFTDILVVCLKRDGGMPGLKCKIRKHGDDSDPAEIARRSVVIPDNHGSKYVVSHSRQPVQRRRRPKVRRLNVIEETGLSRRSQDAMVGNVALVSPVYGSTTGRQVATLFAAPNSPGTWTLYASETNQTQFQLVDTPASMESISDLTPVTLEMGAPGETRTCATYNSNPQLDGSKAENMTMEPCADRAAPEEGDKSQIFMYNSTSGTLSPTWNSGADSANAAGSSPLDRNSTTLSNATATSSAVQAAATLPADPPNPTKQNSTVVLVFTPLKAMIEDVDAQLNSTTTGTTLTMTKTVTVFSVASTSAGLSSSTSNTAPQATLTSSVLDVQLVGAATPFSNGTGSAAIGSASVSTSSSTATRSVDAAAVASRIAMSASPSGASAAGSSTVTSSSMDGASPSSTQAAQRRAIGRLAAFELKRTTVSTEPYTWMFKTGER